jgi:hypothetical protein
MILTRLFGSLTYWHACRRRRALPVLKPAEP